MKQFFTFLLLLGCMLLKAQKFTCSFDSTKAYKVRQNSDAVIDLKAFMLKSKAISKKLPSLPNKGLKRSTDTTINYIIPITVHVIHAGEALGTGSNISDYQVNNQIAKLNEYYKPYGIRFCLAKRDADDLGTSGITRRYDPLNTYRLNVDETALMALDQFPRERCINIWVVKQILDDNGVPVDMAGAGSYPDSRKMGIVVRSDFFGGKGTCTGCVLNSTVTSVEGKVLVHEMGHFLGLLHTHEEGCAGMTANTCDSAGDYICDTPPMRYVNFNCRDTNTCDETPNNNKPDPIHNYMGYKNESCMNEFTNEQVQVMYANIETYLETLIDPFNLWRLAVDGCGYHTALFNSDKTLLCGIGSIELQAFDTFIHKNPPHSYQWSVYNTTTKKPPTYGSNNNFTPTLTDVGTYDITLTVTAGLNTITRTRKGYVQVINCGNSINSTRGNWYFGQYAGLEFRQNATIPNDQAWKRNKPTVNSRAGCIVQNNATGRLLFYGGGRESGGQDSFLVFDKNHNKMPHGNIYGTTLSQQGGVVVPVTGSGSRFYLFTTNWQNLSGDKLKFIGLHFSIIDTTLNGGKGDVDVSYRDIPVTGPAGRKKNSYDNALYTGEGIAAIPACTTGHYWLIVAATDSSAIDSFIEIYKIDNTGVNFYKEINLGFEIYNGTTIVASPDGRYLSVCGVLFEFNRKNAGLKFIKNLQTSYSGVPYNAVYGATFNKASTIFYLANEKLIDPVKQITTVDINQYDLHTDLSNPTVTPVSNKVSQLQRGPDNKIYMVQEDNEYMSVIHQPDSLNGFTDNNNFTLKKDDIRLKIGLSQMLGQKGLPNFVDAKPETEIVKRIIHVQKNCNQFYFSTNVCCAATYIWNFGDDDTSHYETINHSYTGKTDTKYITLTIDGIIVLYDTIRFGSTGLAIDGRSGICDTSNYSYYFVKNARTNKFTYYWSATNGTIRESTLSKSVDVKWQQPGSIKVISTDKFGCKDTATLNVSFVKLIKNNKISVQSQCLADTIKGRKPTGGNGVYQYDWQYRIAGSKGSFIPLGHNDTNYLPTTSSNIREFQRVVVSAGCESYSNLLEVASLNSANTIRKEYDYCYYNFFGNDAIKFYPSAVYQWQSSLDQVTWANVSGQNSQNYIGWITRDTLMYFMRKVVNGICSSYSNVLVSNLVDISGLPTEFKLCKRDKSFPLTLNYKITKNNGSAYWVFLERRHVGGVWKEIDKKIDYTKTVHDIYEDESDTFRNNDTLILYVVEAGCNGLDDQYSDTMIVRFIDTAIITLQPSNKTVAAGGSVKFRIAVTDSSNYTYQWQSSPNGTTQWRDLPNSDSTFLNLKYIGACQSNYYYRCAITEPCKIKYSNVAQLTVTGITSPLFDYWMKDQWYDTGAERNLDTVDLVHGYDIWVRHSLKDWKKQHQEPAPDIDTNWVAVTVRNKGSQPTLSGKLYLYWTWGATGEEWTRHWLSDTRYRHLNSIFNTDSNQWFPTGGEINKIPIELPLINPQDSITIKYPWTNVPRPTWFYPWSTGDTVRHNRANVCLLARIQTCDESQYGMTFKEKKNVLYNVGRNNNIITRNTWVRYMNGAPKGTGDYVYIDNHDHNQNGGPVILRNLDDSTTIIKFCVDVINPAYLAKANIYLKMGDELKAAWQLGGSTLSGISYVGDNYFKITSSTGCIENIAVDSGFAYPVHTYYGYTDINDRFLDAGVYPITFRQYNSLDVKQGECWMDIKDNPYASVTTEIDSIMTVCNSENVSPDLTYVTYSVPDETLQYDIQNKNFTDSFVTLNGTGIYDLSPSNYVVTTYDTINNKILKTNLTVSSIALDTAYGGQSIEYTCEDSTYLFYSLPCVGSVIKDKDGNVIDNGGSDYYLDPQLAPYTQFCMDADNCKVNKTQLTFRFIPDVDPETDDYAYGIFDRSGEDTCCFVSLNHLECSGTELSEGDTIEIFTMGYDLSASYLLTTTLQYYGESEILGFRFCPPYWNTAEEEINNWYRIVMRKDTCDLCRFDFMCDSTIELSRMALENKPDNSVKANLNTNQKSNTNVREVSKVSKVANPEGGITTIAIFPNPASQIVNIKIANIADNNVKVTMYDNTGKLVYFNEYSANKNISIKINMSDFDDGVYTISIPELNYYYKLVLIK